MIWVVLVAMTMAPVAVMWVIFNVGRVGDAIESAWRRLRKREPEPELAPIPVQKIVSDLRRLNAFLDELDRSDAPARAERLKAAVLAYDDVLLIACRTLDVPAPERGPLDSVERLQTEAALAQHGLVW